MLGRGKATAMVFIGEVKNGVIVLPEGLTLPEGTQVQIVLSTASAPPTNEPTLGASLMRFAGICDDMPEDSSEQVDHYLYGTPKR
jgi:hypothetical protein